VTNEEICEAVFAAIELANELGIQYAVDDVAEFAEDLHSEVHGDNE